MTRQRAATVKEGASQGGGEAEAGEFSREKAEPLWKGSADRFPVILWQREKTIVWDWPVDYNHLFKCHVSMDRHTFTDITMSVLWQKPLILYLPTHKNLPILFKMKTTACRFCCKLSAVCVHTWMLMLIGLPGLNTASFFLVYWVCRSYSGLIHLLVQQLAACFPQGLWSKWP